MEIMQSWIIGVTAAALLLAVASALAPEGGVKRAVRLCGGLVVFIAVLSPLRKVQSLDMGFQIEQYRAGYEGYEEALIYENSIMVKEIIQERTRTYILQKAEGLGMECDAEVRTATSDAGGYPYPVGVTVMVLADPENRKEELSRIIAADLGVDRVSQIWSSHEG